MFSSFVSYVSSSLSPKAWLAHYIAQGLNEFFLLDPQEQDTQHIEANLLKDTKIVLHNVTVRPRACDSGCSANNNNNNNAWLYGSVAQMELSWTWGGTSEGSSFVRDTRLAIRGAKFRIEIGGEAPASTASTASAVNGSSTASPMNHKNTGKTSSQGGGYIQRHLQQIMDHLTLDISDVTLVLEDRSVHGSSPDPTPSQHRLCLDARGLQLVSFGRQQDGNPAVSTEAAAAAPPLAQRISLASIAIYLESPTDNDNDDDDKVLPILDPIGYAASVKRVAGRRFLDGWATGLEIVGEVLVSRNNSGGGSSSGSGGGFVLHAGVQQVKALGEMMNHLVVPNNLSIVEKNSSLERTASGNDSFYDCQSETSSAASSSSSSPSTTAPATTILLPLPSITVVFPSNGTSISTPQCNFLYSLDGSTCRLYGNQGVWIGEEPLITFVEDTSAVDDSKCGWLMDWTTHQVSLKRSFPPGTTTDNLDRSVAHVQWKDETMKQVFQGVLDIASAIPSQLSEQVETAVYEYSTLTATTETAQQEDNSGPAWSFETNGPIALTATCQEEWIQAELGTIRVELSSLVDKSSGMFPFSQFDVASISVGPTSFGETKVSAIRIPAVSLQEATNDDDSSKPKLLVKGDLSATLESKQVGVSLHDFCNRLLDFPTQDYSSESPAFMKTAGTSGTTSRLLVEIPSMSLCIIEESMKLSLSDIQIGLENGNIYGDCGSVHGWSGTDEMISVKGMKVPIGHSEECIILEVHEVSRLCLPGFLDAISEPIRNVSVQYRGSDGGVKVQSRSRVAAVVSSALLQKTPEQGQREKVTRASSTFPPFPIQVEIPELELSLLTTNSSFSIRPFRLSLTQLESDAVEIEIPGGKTSLRLEIQEDGMGPCFIEACLAGTHKIGLQTSPAGEPKLDYVQCGPLHLGPSSVGSFAVDIPSISVCNIIRNAPEIMIEGCIKAVVQSTATVMNLQAMLQRAMGLSSEKAGPADALPGAQTASPWQNASANIPKADIVIQGPQKMHLLGNGIVMRSSQIEIESSKISVSTEIDVIGSLVMDISLLKVVPPQSFQQGWLSVANVKLNGSTGFATEICQAETSFESSETALVKIARIETGTIPGMVHITQPVLGTSIKFANGLLEVDVPAFVGICPLLASTEQVKAEQASGTVADLRDSRHTGALIPFSTQVKLGKLKLQSCTDSTTSLWVASLVVKVDPSGDALSVGTGGNIRVRVVDSVQNAWVEGTFSPLTALVKASGDTFEPVFASCGPITIGPCSYGNLQLAIPSINLSDNRITFGDISGSLDSMDLVLQIQSLWHQLIPPQPESVIPFTILIPKVVLSVSALEATAVAENSVFDGRDGSLNCDRFGLQNNSGLAAAFSGLQAVIYPTPTIAKIQIVDCFYIPDVCSLENPLRKPISVAFQDDALCIDLPPVDLIVFESKSRNDNKVSEGSINIPFPVRLNLQHLSVKSFHQEGEVTHIDQLAFHARPQEKDPFSPDESSSQCVLFHAVISQMENKLIKVAKTNASGVIIGGNLSTIHHFKLSTEGANVSAGFSSVDWSSIFGSEASRQSSIPVALPFCRVETFTAHLQYRGKVIGVENTAVRVHEFVGAAATNSKDLIQHLKKSILDRAPAMLTNAKIFGQSVSEMAATTAGGAYLAASTMPMAAAGCVVGVAAHDSIRGAVASGKSIRGATAGDGYQFGDFSRGVVHSVKQAARSGSEARRGTKDYQVGDFTVGASKSVTKYSSQNKSRLGSAGGSGAGMLIGCAVAGPLGLVAGSLIGSKLGRSAFEDEQRPEDKRSQASPRQTATVEQAVNFADADLLGIGMAPPGCIARGQDTAEIPARQMGQQKQYPQQTQQYYQQPSAHPQPKAQQRQQQTQQHYQQPSAHPQPKAQQPQQQQQQQQQRQQGYHFGDLTKGVIAKGKEKTGRSDADSYKFGDFTRGLFGR